jgi:predicted enzyme related to lactoylglutathione lyase
MKTTSAATVMPVSDFARALHHYVTVLGFSKRFEHGGFYAGIELGAAQIHLNAKGRSAPGSGDIYIFCDEVDAYHADIVGRGARVEAPPKTEDYGVRDFVSYDPDGNRVSFGAIVSAE